MKMGIRQFTLYQMKDTSDTRPFRFRPYKLLQEKGIRVWQGIYEQAYAGIMLPGDTPEKIRERFNRKLPRSFQGHSISVSDVLVLKTEDVDAAYYVDADGFVVLDGFFYNGSPGTQVSFGDTNVWIKGKEGTWHAFDSIRIEKNRFFLMEHERYGKKAAWVVVDENGNLVVDGVHEGFVQPVQEKIRDYVEQNRRKREGKVQNHVTIRETQRRTSVLAKLRQKQKEIAENKGKKMEV